MVINSRNVSKLIDKKLEIIRTATHTSTGDQVIYEEYKSLLSKCTNSYINNLNYKIGLEELWKCYRIIFKNIKIFYDYLERFYIKNNNLESLFK